MSSVFQPPPPYWTDCYMNWKINQEKTQVKDALTLHLSNPFKPVNNSVEAQDTVGKTKWQCSSSVP